MDENKERMNINSRRRKLNRIKGNKSKVKKLTGWIICLLSDSNLNIIAGLAMILGFIAFLTQFGKFNEGSQLKEQTAESIDILIPEGQSLVPIRVANNESLNRIIGSYGVVDLYSTPLSPGEKALRIAYKVKLVRSPGNSSGFNVLIPADEAT